MQNLPKLTSVVLALGVVCCCIVTQLILTDPEALLPENKPEGFMRALEFWRRIFAGIQAQESRILIYGPEDSTRSVFSKHRLYTIDLWR